MGDFAVHLRQITAEVIAAIPEAARAVVRPVRTASAISRADCVTSAVPYQ